MAKVERRKREIIMDAIGLGSRSPRESTPEQASASSADEACDACSQAPRQAPIEQMGEEVRLQAVKMLRESVQKYPERLAQTRRKNLRGAEVNLRLEVAAASQLLDDPESTAQSLLDSLSRIEAEAQLLAIPTDAEALRCDVQKLRDMAVQLQAQQADDEAEQEIISEALMLRAQLAFELGTGSGKQHLDKEIREVSREFSMLSPQLDRLVKSVADRAGRPKSSGLCPELSNITKGSFKDLTARRGLPPSKTEQKPSRQSAFTGRATSASAPIPRQPVPELPAVSSTAPAEAAPRTVGTLLEELCNEQQSPSVPDQGASKTQDLVLQEWDKSQHCRKETGELKELASNAAVLVHAYNEIATLCAAAGDGLDSLEMEVDRTVANTSQAVTELALTDKSMAKGTTVKVGGQAAIVGMGVGFLLGGPVGAAAVGGAAGVTGAAIGKAIKWNRNHKTDAILECQEKRMNGRQRLHSPVGHS